MSTCDFEEGDRVEHETLGKGTFYSYGDSPIGNYELYKKGWVSFDDHEDYIAVSIRLLKPLSPGPKPESYLELRENRLVLIDHYRNHGDMWCAYSRKEWVRTLEGKSRRFIPISEITEALDE